MLKRRHKVFPLSEKVTALDLIREEKDSYAEFAKTYSKNDSCIMKEKGIEAWFVFSTQSAKVIATVCLNLQVEYLNRKHVLIDSNMLCQNVLSLCV